MDEHEYLGPAGHGRQHFEGLARQTGDTKDQQPPWQARRTGIRGPFGRPTQKGGMDGGPAQVGGGSVGACLDPDIGAQVAP